MYSDQIEITLKTYPIGFFEIQEYFARKISDISGTPFGETLLSYTSYYKRIGAEPWDYSKENPLWKCLIERINCGQSPARAAFELHRTSLVKSIDTTKRFGCMGFSLRGTTIVMHFRNDFSSTYGPLSRHNRKDRLLELKEIFEHIFRYHSEAQMVEGCSWLYSYDVYCRLFPPEYIAGLELMKETPVRIHSAWGQFLNSSGEMDSERVRIFKQKIDATTSLNEMLDSFPFRIFSARAAIKFFYSFYLDEK
jgi:hypothetical protein